MKLEYFGHACFALTFNSGTVLVIDPFDESVAYPQCNVRCDAAILSHDHFDHNHTASLKGDFVTISKAGAYTVGDATITAIDSFHDEEQGALRGKNLLIKIVADGLTIAHLGDLGHVIDALQREFLNNVDLMLLPIGGFYTIDTNQAEAILNDVKPRHAIGMHFTTPEYPAAMSTEAQFASDMDAVYMPKTLTFDKDTLAALPKTMILAYK